MHHRCVPDPESLPLSPIPLTDGTSGESVSVRPSRSVARLVDTIVGGDTGWTLAGVTVGGDEEGYEGEAMRNWLGLSGEHRAQGAHGSAPRTATLRVA